MEETGRLRSTVARRLSTLASSYKYCEQKQFIDVERCGSCSIHRAAEDHLSLDFGRTR